VKPRISVIICAHNPRPDYLRRVLGGLRAQTLPQDQWELLLIDNASGDKLAETWDLSWHPQAKHFREEELGLTPARLRGIMEANADLLVFVDDDNVLDPDYLKAAIQISCEYPFLGTWGGTIRGEFEIEPEPWARPLLGFLGIREPRVPIWSNNPGDGQAEPCGAGLCVRATVARTYADQLAAGSPRRKLDRRGSALSSGGDTDLILTSCDLGQGFGSFPQLTMTHLIPASRLQLDYLIRLIQGITASGVLLRYLRFGDLSPEPSRYRVGGRYILKYLFEGRRQAQIYLAMNRAVQVGIQAARDLGANR